MLYNQQCGRPTRPIVWVVSMLQVPTLSWQGNCTILKPSPVSGVWATLRLSWWGKKVLPLGVEPLPWTRTLPVTALQSMIHSHIRPAGCTAGYCCTGQCVVWGSPALHSTQAWTPIPTCYTKPLQKRVQQGTMLHALPTIGAHRPEIRPQDRLSYTPHTTTHTQPVHWEEDMSSCIRHVHLTLSSQCPVPRLPIPLEKLK